MGGHPVTSTDGQTYPVAAAGDDHPLRRRRGLTQVELAGLAGLSCSYISMIEQGQRTLSRRDHVNALAVVLRVPPAEIAPSITPDFDEWVPALPVSASAFPPLSDYLAVARHREMAAQFMSQVSRGDMYAAGAWLRRQARDPGVNPWLLLDQFTAPDITLPGTRSRPPGGAWRA